MAATTNPELLGLFTRITTCTLQCDGIVNDRSRGIIPRSFFCTTRPSEITLLVVGKNPAHAPDWECALYAGTAAADLANTHLAVVDDLFSGARSVPSNFHVNLLRRVAAVLGVAPTASEVFKYAALSTLTKCQSIGKKTDATPLQTIQTCAETFLFREIALYRPRFLLALGTEVFSFLTSPGVLRIHGLPVGKLWHPSWSNMPGGEQQYFNVEIVALRNQYLEALRET